MFGLLAWSAAQFAQPFAAMAPDPYFPPTFAEPSLSCGGVGPDAIISDFENRWYSAYLGAAREPSLFRSGATAPSGDGFILRFTWLRSFHPAVVIRIEPSPQGGFHLIAKQVSGGGLDPGGIDKKTDRAITASEVTDLRVAMASSAIFDQPPAICELGMDGAQWIIEGVDRSGYHFVKRWSPDGGAVRAMGLHLIGLSKWRFGPIY